MIRILTQNLTRQLAQNGLNSRLGRTLPKDILNPFIYLLIAGEHSGFSFIQCYCTFLISKALRKYLKRIYIENYKIISNIFSDFFGNHKIKVLLY